MARKPKTKCKTSTAKKKCSTNKKKKTIQSTEFSFHAPEAKKVYLAGDFNDWNPEQYSMRKFKTGMCTKKLKLAPGRYEYKFVVDGEWCTDPANDNLLITDMGENSVLEVREDVIAYK